MTSLSERDIAAIHEYAVRWARELGTYAQEARASGLHVEFKADGKRDPVTQVDKAVEARIRELVAGQFPGHQVLGEEAAGGQETTPQNPDDAVVWVVDPIDGTANFAAGLPLWAVSIGVLAGRQPVAGAIWTMAGLEGRPEIFHGKAGGGAFREDTPINVAENAAPEPSKLIGVPGFWSSVYRAKGPLAKGPGEPRVFGSIAIELAYVAAGSLQYSVFGSPKIWDVAAGALIVQEAGGRSLIKQDKRWQELVRYQEASPAKGSAKTGLAALGDWRAPLITGNRSLAPMVAEHLQPTVPWRWVLRRWLRRIKKR